MSGRDKKPDNFSKCTLFVKGIPPSCTNEQLSETFSQAGPVKDCFIVNYKSSEGSKSSEKPRIGYVTYTSTDDVKSALKQAFSIDSKKLAVSIALKKRKKKKEKNLQGDTFEIVKADGKVAEDVANSDECPPEKIVREEKKDIDKKFSVLLGGLPILYKKEHVLNLWKKNGLKIPLEVDIPYQEDPAAPKNTDSEIQASKTVQSAKISVVSKQAALKACNKLSGIAVGKIDNFILKATLIAPGDNLKSARKSRLIVRNLSFKCSDNELRKAFDPYGTITEVKIPTRPNGLKLGFAFVQFSHVFEAARAIKAMNLQPIKDRKVAVDWSLPKEKYKELNTKIDEGGQNIEKEEDASKNEESEEEQTDAQDGDEEESASLDASDEDSLPDESGNDDVEEDGEQSDEESSSENEEEDDSDAEVEEDGKNKYDEDLQKVKKKAKHNKNTSYDVHEGKTVFVMNLSFDTKEEKLTEVLAEYGKLNYTKIVLNHETGMSKGCGFAQFATVEDAQNCIASIGRETSELIVDGRQISAVAALTRGDTDHMRKEGKKKIEKEDKRNLYLAREGLIRAGTQAAEGLSQIELKKRERMENTKRAKLRNPSVFVSKTRLCVHNLPKSMEGSKLKEIILEQFPNKKAIRISECRIMRDRRNLNEKGIGRSLGYAFVMFSDHQNALTTLRSLNNNPDVFGPLKRPIVEFVLENKRALETKQQRQVKYEAKMKLKEKIRNVDGQTEWKKEDNVYEKGKKLFQNRRRDGMGDNGNLVKNQKKRSFDNSVPKSFVADRKSFQGASGTTLMGKKLPMPVHAGAKIRQKNKGKVMDQLRRSKKLNTKAGQQKMIREFSQNKEKEFIGKKGKVESQRDSKMGTTTGSVNTDGGGRRKRKGDEDSEFNALVSKYTKKIMDNIPKPVKSGAKWYE